MLSWRVHLFFLYPSFLAFCKHMPRYPCYIVFFLSPSLLNISWLCNFHSVHPDILIFLHFFCSRVPRFSLQKLLIDNCSTNNRFNDIPIVPVNSTKPLILQLVEIGNSLTIYLYEISKPRPSFFFLDAERRYSDCERTHRLWLHCI